MASADGKGPLEATRPLEFRRARATRALALLGLAMALFALVGPLPAIGIDDSLQAPALGGAVGCLFAVALLSLWGALPEYVRIVVAMFGFVVPAALVDLFVPREAVRGLAVIAAVAAFLLVLYEWRSGVKLSTEGVAWRRGLPWLKECLIPWGDIETVTASLRVISTRFVGESLPVVESQCGFVLSGAGQWITFGTPRYRWQEERGASDPRWAAMLLSRAGPPAIAWTVGQLRTAGRIRLGRVELTRTGVAIRRLRGWTTIESNRLRGLDIEGGFLRFDTEHGRIRVPIKKVPNGLFLPEILKAANG